MNIAHTVKLRSHDPKTKVGSVLVSLSDNRIISTGYNGLPSGINEKEIDWNNRDENLRNKIIHSEINTLLYANSRFENTILYTTLSPCIDCIKVLAATNVKKIYYDNEYKDFFKVKELCCFFGIDLININKPTFYIQTIDFNPLKNYPLLEIKDIVITNGYSKIYEVETIEENSKLQIVKEYEVTEFIYNFYDKLPCFTYWDIVIKEAPTISYDFIYKFKKYINWDILITSQQLDDRTIIENFNILDVSLLCVYQKLSENIMKLFAHKLKWDLIIVNQTLNETFIEEMKGHIDFLQVVYYQKLSETFIEKHINDIDMTYVLFFTKNNLFFKLKYWYKIFI
jgi:dCMP deaminase